MAIITDSIHSIGHESYLRMLGDDVFFRKSDYIFESELYRYRSNIERAAEEIRTGNIYLSNRSGQNDPFDSSYGLSNEDFFAEEHPVKRLIRVTAKENEGKEDLYSSWLEKTNIPLDELVSVDYFAKKMSCILNLSESFIKYRIKQMLCLMQRRHETQYRIACFSEEKASIPMWAYYANNHKGVCLEYDLARLNVEDEYEFELKRAFCKVHYSNYRPKDKHGDYSLVVKSSQWSHEKEWRLICDPQNNYISVPCLSAVYLGMYFEIEHLDLIVSAIKARKESIALYTCRPDYEMYSIQCVEIMI